MASLTKKSILLVFCLLAASESFAEFKYKPSVGDKFQYKISIKTKRFESTFIYDVKNKIPSFHYKWGLEAPVWGTWNGHKKPEFTIANDITDTVILKNSNLIFVSKDILELAKSGKIFKLSIGETLLELKLTGTFDYNLPIANDGIPLKIITVATEDKKWSLSLLDNPSFPLITNILGDVSWYLEKIVPLPTIAFTHNIVGLKLDSKKAALFKSYTHETCVMVEAQYTENFRNVMFNEYFCPSIGVRFSVKNDTIVSVKLLSKNHSEDGYTWETFHGYFWGTYRLGDSKKNVERPFGKPKSSLNNKSYYPRKGFYLIYNSKGVLEEVDYE